MMCNPHGRSRAGCPRCQRIDRAYAARRRRMIADGTWLRPVPAETVLAHITTLRATSMSVVEIARAAGVPEATLRSAINAPRKTLHGPVAAAILAVEPRPTVPAGHVPPNGAGRRLRALVAAGYAMPDLGQRLGWRQSQVWEVAWEKSTYITDRTHRKVAALYDELEGTSGPSLRARNIGLRNGWPPPNAWTDIDNPDAEPNTDTDFVDAVRVDTALAGERVPLTPLERHHAVHEGQARDMSMTAIARRLGISHNRAKALAAEPLPTGYELVA